MILCVNIDHNNVFLTINKYYSEKYICHVFAPLVLYSHRISSNDCSVASMHFTTHSMHDHGVLLLTETTKNVGKRID